MKHYMHPVSMTSRPVRLFIAENKLDVDEVVVDLMVGEHHQQPPSQHAALRHDPAAQGGPLGKRLRRHLDRRFGGEGTRTNGADLIGHSGTHHAGLRHSFVRQDRIRSAVPGRAPVHPPPRFFLCRPNSGGGFLTLCPRTLFHEVAWENRNLRPA